MGLQLFQRAQNARSAYVAASQAQPSPTPPHQVTGFRCQVPSPTLKPETCHLTTV